MTRTLSLAERQLCAVFEKCCWSKNRPNSIINVCLLGDREIFRIVLKFTVQISVKFYGSFTVKKMLQCAQCCTMYTVQCLVMLVLQAIASIQTECAQFTDKRINLQSFVIEFRCPLILHFISFLTIDNLEKIALRWYLDDTHTHWALDTFYQYSVLNTHTLAQCKK